MNPLYLACTEEMITRFNSKNIIICCTTVKEALFQATQQDFQIALIDYNLPDGFGPEVLSVLPSNCIKLGMSGKFLFPEICHLFTAFFSKPFRIRELQPFFSLDASLAQDRQKF